MWHSYQNGSMLWPSRFLFRFSFCYSGSVTTRHYSKLITQCRDIYEKDYALIYVESFEVTFMLFTLSNFPRIFWETTHLGSIHSYTFCILSSFCSSHWRVSLLPAAFTIAGSRRLHSLGWISWRSDEFLAEETKRHSRMYRELSH